MALTSGIFTLSIDLDLDPSRPAQGQLRPLEEITDRLIRLLAKYDVPATWGLADPAVSAARDTLAGAKPGHEIAILGDPSWVGHEAGRSRFARELTRRTTRARAAGLAVSTLLLRAANLTDHLDIAVKHGITAVRNSAVVRSRAPQQLRYGLWHIPASEQLPGASRWRIGGGGGWSIGRQIRLAGQPYSVVHVAVDALRMAERGAGALHVLESVVRQAAAQRVRGSLAIETLAVTARRLTGARVSLPSRSILRRAA